MVCGARCLAFVAISAVLAGMLPSARASTEIARAHQQEPEPQHLEVRRRAAAGGKEATLVIEGKEDGDEKR